MEVDLSVNSVNINLYDKIHFASVQYPNKIEIKLSNIKFDTSKLNGI